MTIFMDLLTMVVAVISGSGLFALYVRRQEQKDSGMSLIKGLAHHTIVRECIRLLENPDTISTSEYESLNRHLFKPYLELGGNGLTVELMEQVRKATVSKAVEA